MRRMVVVAVALLTLTACGATKQDAPEPMPSDIINGTHTQVIKMPDGFRNLAFTCYGTTGIYVTSRGITQESGQSIASLPSSLAVLANDPKCR